MIFRNFGASDGYYPSSANLNAKSLKENYEKLKLENLSCKQRCEQLESLCKGMYVDFGNHALTHRDYGLASLMDVFKLHMEALGLLDGVQE